MPAWKNLVASLIRTPLRWCPPRLARRAILELIRGQLGRRPPREGLRFLMGLDNDLYALEGQAAAALEQDGKHPKHRLIGYHDFFVGLVRPGQRVLDVGCGSGNVARALAERAGALVVAMDNDPQVIQMARRLNPHPNLEYLVGDAREPLPAGSFQVVVLSNVLEHLEHRVEFLRRLAEAHHPERVLIRVPLVERDWRVPLKRELGVEWRLDQTHHTEYTLESLASEMDQAGLEVVQMQVRWGEIWAMVRPRP